MDFGNQTMEYQIPADKVAVVIGKRGVMVKSLNTKFMVKIATPNQQDIPTNNMHKIKIQGPKNNVDACWNEIQQLIQKVGQNPNPNPNGGGNANSPFGQQQQQGLGGQQQGLGGGGGNNPICEGYIFKVNTKTMNLELLLQCTTAHGWAVPGGVMDQQNDSQLNFATGLLRILHTDCGGAGSVPFDGLHALGAEKIDNKIFHHLCLPQWSNNHWSSWGPAPTQPRQMAFGQPTPLNVAGETQTVAANHAWVPVGLIQCDPSFSTPLKTWTKNFADKYIQQAVAEYKKNTIQAVAQPWTQTARGVAILTNLFSMMEELKKFMGQDNGIATFTQAVNHCFSPDELTVALKKWEQAGQKLPKPM